MKVEYRHFKNSNNGTLVKSQHFTDTEIKGIPVYFYDVNGKKIGEDLELKGFVQISEKKYIRLSKRKID